MSLFLIELYSEDVRKKRSEVGEEYGFRLQGKYVQKWSFVYSPPHTLKESETFGNPQILLHSHICLINSY